MEALDLEEEKFYDDSENIDNLQWCKDYQLKLKEHLKQLYEK